MQEVLQHGSREFLDLAALLVLGCAIAATVQTLLPRSWLLAVVVSVCSSVDAFLALGFAAQVTPGALLAFLVLGPVVDLKLLGLFRVLFKPKAIALTSAAAAVAVLVLGQWVNLLRL